MLQEYSGNTYKLSYNLKSMTLDKFDYEEQKVIEELKKRKIKRALLQLPEGLKQEAVRLANLFEKETGTEIIVSGETCWGACDMALNEAKDTNSEIIIHYGHAQFIKKLEFPVIYIEMKDKTPIGELLNKSTKTVKDYKTIGLVCSVQHIYQQEEAKKFYEKQGKEVIIPRKLGYAHYDGHVVGCEYNSLKSIKSKVEAFVVIGNRFHALGAALAVRNPVYLLDVYNNEVQDMTKLRDKIIKQRIAAIEKTKQAKKIGIIVGLKPGQKFGNMKVIREKFENKGKKVIVITMSEITADKLTNFYDIEAFVELACPRIAIEDYSKYAKTLVTFREALAAIGEIKWEDLIENGFL